jgi:hypothetical protein
LKTSIYSDREVREDIQQAVIAFRKYMVLQFKYPHDQRQNNATKQRQIGSTRVDRYGGRGRGTQSHGGRGRGGGRDNSRSGRGYGRNSNNSNNRNQGSPSSDNMYIPRNVLQGLTPVQRAMMFAGRNELERRNQQNSSNTVQSRNIGSTNTQIEDPSVLTTQSTSNQSVTNNTHQHGSASSHFGRRTSFDPNLNNRQQGGVSTSSRRWISRAKAVPTQIDYHGRYRLEIDSRSDTMCCGRGFVQLFEVDQVCDVHGFHPDMEALKNIPISTCATAYDHGNGETYILVFGQALYFGDTMKHSLLSPNQVRSFHHKLCLNPKMYTHGESLHGIVADDVTFPFHMHGCISYLPIRHPTPDEIDRCPHIHMTSDELWEPYADSFGEAEASFDPHRRIGATSSREHRSSIPIEELARRNIR